jgi:hypothetical protein
VHCNRLKKFQAERKLYSDKQIELVNENVNNNRALKYTNSRDKYNKNNYPKRNINWKIETSGHHLRSNHALNENN